MQPESPALIWDARRAAGRVVEFVSGRSWDDYRQDVMLRSAVERQFQIIGEALNRLSKVDPGTGVGSRTSPGSSPSHRPAEAEASEQQREAHEREQDADDEGDRAAPAWSGAAWFRWWGVGGHGCGLLSRDRGSWAALGTTTSVR